MRSRAIGGLLALLLSAAGCAADPSTIRASLEDFRIEFDRANVPSGRTTLHVGNLGGGTSQSVHELVLLRTPVPNGRLPTLPSGTVDEQADVLTVVGRTEPLAPGEGATLEVDLQGGRYLAVCNILGHYAQGMVAGFTVEGISLMASPWSPRGA